jgi:hypothetical protein
MPDRLELSCHIIDTVNFPNIIDEQENVAIGVLLE